MKDTLIRQFFFCLLLSYFSYFIIQETLILMNIIYQLFGVLQTIKLSFWKSFSRNKKIFLAIFDY